ncbi:FMN-binding protein [Arthrobacter sp. 92]|jgi:uncharacterized protein with FMN-binding domain|uniref:FMN-binding protein n=1 Tax=Arthrobacter sp. 92 TaxID=3418175 RepID=UPI003D021A3A
MTSPARKSIFVGIAGLSLAGTVAGCAPTAQSAAVQSTAAPSTATQSTAAPAMQSPTGAAGSAATASAAGYKDGIYSADGSYLSPGGPQTVGVQLTLANGTVSDVTITPHPTDPNTREYQGEFAAGIKDQVVGKKLDELNVSKVAGSSLTGGGFNEAVAKIKAQAK